LLQSVISPSPLYNGTTLLALHEVGANCSMADLFRKSVTVGSTFYPSHLIHYVGMLLSPVLLLAG
jgi:hypothetical protein